MADRERLDDLFTYFQSAQDIIDANIDAPTGYEPDLARLSRDPVLNALAQLGISRLGCDRAFVSLIDDQHQYVVAEVSKSISLFNADIHAPNDGLAIGVRALDLFSGVCAGTMSAFTDPSGSQHVMNDNMVTDMTKFVVKDFSVEPLYQSRAYVTGFPWMRFYAGVPILSKSGHVIGTYAVVDNKPRQGLSHEDHHILTEISSTIMRYLELLQTQSSRDSAFNALKGIKSFVQDSATLASATAESRSRKFFTKKRPPNTTKAVPAEIRRSPEQIDLRKAVSPGEDSHVERAGTSMLHQGTEASLPIVDATSTATMQHPDAETQPNQYKTLLAQAAARVQEAMCMEEVFFLAAPTVRRTSEDHVLSPQPSIVNRPGSHGFNGSEAFEETLDELLSQYPGGSYFNFAAKHSQIDIETFSNRSDCLGSIDLSLCSDLNLDVLDRKFVKNLDTALLTALPLAKSMLWLPLFNAEHKDCPWAMIAWSSESKRILTEEDFSYLTLFGIAVQADFARTKSANQNRAKSDVISSISHELRSPLHGILGNVELLLESDMTVEQQQMVLMVEKCGRSLLATMEHILLHSKINNNSTKGSRGSMDEPYQPERIDLSVLIENGIDTIMSGSAFRSLMTSSHSPQVQSFRTSTYESSRESVDIRSGPSINLRIGHSQSWLTFTEAAVWSRCLMKILGNALKYTESGSIEVNLEMKEHVGTENMGAHSREVTLSITDTGRGMSPDYLREHLYQPFLQENNTSDGLGLGLSIVNTLVHSIDGSVTVQSKLGEGTTVDIVVPVRVDQVDDANEPKISTYAGRKVFLVSDEPNIETANLDSTEVHSSLVSNQKTISTLAEYCTEWYQMNVSCCTVKDIPEAEVLVMFEKTLRFLERSDLGGKRLDHLLEKHAVVVIPDIYVTRIVSASISDQGLFHLAPPFGPNKVALVLDQAFNYTDKLKSDRVTQTSVHDQDVSVSVAVYHDQAVGSPLTPREGAGGEKISLNIKVGNGVPIADQDHLAKPDKERRLAKISTKPHVASPRHISVQSMTPGTPFKRVLIVDDNEVNLKFLERCLGRWNIDYQTACNGAVAVETFQQPDLVFDCVLMDISMPVMNGLEATRAIRAWEDTQRSKVRSRIYALTGLSDDATREDALASGMDKFVTKPFNIKDIGILLNMG